VETNFAHRKCRLWLCAKRHDIEMTRETERQPVRFFADTRPICARPRPKGISSTAKPAFYNNSAIDILSRSFVNQSLLLMDDGRISAFSRGTLDRTALRFAEGNSARHCMGCNSGHR
jgi:hypothetical protein